MHVGLATQEAEDMEVEILICPAHLCSLKIGVWHHALYAKGDKPVNVLVLLAERTYHNDCEVKPCNFTFGEKR